MPWCPKCKNEYKEGYTTCAECGVDLVAELPSEKDYSGEEEFPNMMNEQMSEAASEESTDNEEAFDEGLEEGICETCVHESSASKAENHKSSAYTLLLIGIAGIIVIILGAFDVLPIHLVGITKYMTYGVMGALFILFIVMGAVSMKSYHFFSKKAESENSVRDTMEKWCLEELNAEEIDQKLGILRTESLSENLDETSNEDSDKNSMEISMEEKYFRRTKYLKEILNKKYLNLDNDFLDNFIDEIYNDIFNE